MSLSHTYKADTEHSLYTHPACVPLCPSLTHTRQTQSTVCTHIPHAYPYVPLSHIQGRHRAQSVHTSRMRTLMSLSHTYKADTEHSLYTHPACVPLCPSLTH